MAKRTLTVALDLESKKFNSELGRAEKKLGGFGGSVKKLGGVLAGAFAVREVGQFALSAIDSASNLAEEVSKSEAVFGDAAASIQAFGETAATAVGLSESAALAAASQFGQLGKAADLSGGDLEGFATDLVQLSADLASFNNLEVEEAAAKLRAGLVGETEPLKQLGIFFTAADVEARAMAMGLAESTAALTEQDKILARQALIFEQTSDAQGDFARTSDGLANQQRILSAQFENVKADLGAKLLPVMLKFVTFLNEKAIPAISDIAEWLEVNVPKAVDKVKEVVEALRQFWEPLWNSLKARFQAFVDAIQFIVAIFRGDWDQAWQELKSMFGNIWDDMKERLRLILAIMRTLVWNALKAIGDWFKGLGEDLLGVLVDAGEWLIGIGEAIIDGLKQGLINKWEDVKNWFIDKGNWIKDQFTGLFGILSPSTVFEGYGEAMMQGLALGLSDGATLNLNAAVAGTANTAASPMNVTGGGGGGPIVVSVQVDGREIAQAVATASQDMGGIPLRTRAA